MAACEYSFTDKGLTKLCSDQPSEKLNRLDDAISDVLRLIAFHTDDSNKIIIDDDNGTAVIKIQGFDQQTKSLIQLVLTRELYGRADNVSFL